MRTSERARVVEGGRPRRRRPRQADIARLAGVSQATVSMVINHQGGKYRQIGEETRRRVWAAVEELGYVANPAARVLAGGRSSLLGVYTFEPVFPIDQRDFYYPFLLGMEEEAERLGFDLVLFTSTSGPDRNRAIFRDGVNRLGVADGCVLLGRAGAPEEVGQLLEDGFPFVFVGRRELPGQPVAYVGADYTAATAEVVGYLADLGHRRIAYLGWADRSEPTVDRRRGYEAAHDALGRRVDAALARQVADADVTVDLLDTLHAAGATAVVVQDEMMAARVVAAAGQRGFVVPRDLSVAVLGDPPRGRPTGHDWTGFVIPRREMGATALATLVGLIDDGADTPPQLLLPCAFHAGDTTARPRPA